MISPANTPLKLSFLYFSFTCLLSWGKCRKRTAWFVRRWKKSHQLYKCTSGLRSFYQNKSCRRCRQYISRHRPCTLRHCRSLRSALPSAPNVQMTYADFEGNIGFQAVDLIPVRPRSSGLFPVPGWTDENEWSGFVAFEDMKAMQGDDLCNSAFEILPYLKGVSFEDTAVGTARDRLFEWDGRMDMESPEAALYGYFWASLVEEIFKDQIHETLWNAVKKLLYG